MINLSLHLYSPWYKEEEKTIWDKHWMLGEAFDAIWTLEFNINDSSSLIGFNFNTRVASSHDGAMIGFTLFNREVTLELYDNVHVSERNTREWYFERIGTYLGRKTRNVILWIDRKLGK